MIDTRYVFFGTSIFSVYILDELSSAGLVPSLIVTTPDKPKGRKLVMTPSPVKEWAIKNNISFIQPLKLKDPAVLSTLSETQCELFIVASYGKILPKDLLDLAKEGTLNVHPSLLPAFRGASPLESSILADVRETGVSIMLLDEEMDHGPIIAQERVSIPDWPIRVDVLERTLGSIGGKLLAKNIPEWIDGKIKPIPQEHDKASYTKKIKKEDGLISLSGDPYQNFLKIQAFHGWPGTYFFVDRHGIQIRVTITEAIFKDGVLTIEKVIPEGKKEMPYQDFLRGLK